MASSVRAISLTAVLLLLAVVASPSGVVSLTTREYESMQRVLRGHGYNLVCNAMATSDLQWLLLTLPANASFTIFAPTDASLFALDMTLPASSYTDTLRFHVVPLRLSLFNLRSLAAGSVLPTLLPSSALRLVSTRPLSVGGVDVVLPGLFYSRHVAVHGLGGIVSLASLVPYSSPSPVPKVKPMATTDDSNRTDLNLSPVPKVEPMPTTDDSNRTDFNFSPEIAPSPVTTGSPSSSPNVGHEISPASVPEDEISPAAATAPAQSPLKADSVAERARVLLMEINAIPDREKSKAISDADQTMGGESQPSMMKEQPEVINKLEKCGALDEMAIDCFVPDGATGLDHSSVHRVVRVLT
ncbi:fasciclin-like arabinogalactan protein 19 [Pyrus communis]|uniref:fasciclin-like arabinogalactan protein 19 n=1 Tax=Pyrus communis TaxID=23211 RepID=UPI0035C1579D